MADLLALFRTFVRTAEAGSFTAVARELHSSQPTISRQISLLEQHLGCLLFQRTTRALTLTDDGRIIYEHARLTLEAAAQAEGAVGRRMGQPSGLLKLGCSGVFARLQVIPRLSRFRVLYPDLDVALMINDGFSALIEEGIDLAFRVGDISDTSLIARRVGTTRRVVVATPDYLDRCGIPQHPSDLVNHECVVYDRLLTGVSWSFVTPDGVLSVPVRGPVQVNNTEAARACVLAGLGIGYVPIWHFAQGEIEDGRLVALLPDYGSPPQPINALYPSRRFLAPKVRAAIDFFADEFELDPKLRDGAS